MQIQIAMNTNIVITLDTRRAKQDGTYPIIFRLSHQNMTLPISSGYAISKNSWDSKNRKIKNSCKELDNITRVNNYLVKTKARYLDIITALNDKDRLSNLSIKEIKEHLVLSKERISFYQYAQQQIKTMNEQGRLGNALSYRNTLRLVKKFKANKDIGFQEINYTFLNKLEESYLSRGLSVNGLAVHMRTLRAIYNKAIKDKITDKEAYPFDEYSIKSKPTKKRAISPEAIQKIVVLSYEDESSLFHARNYFLLSFYLMGASYVDMCFLKRSNIIDGRVQYKRRKTGQFYDIKISDSLKPILDYYLKDKQPDDFVLPIIKRETNIDQYNDFLWARKRYNKRLKQIAKDAGIEENLTSYVSRHSFASIANNMAIPVTAISEMLGHQKLTTTQVYLAGLSKDAIDDYNQKIITGG